MCKLERIIEIGNLRQHQPLLPQRGISVISEVAVETHSFYKSITPP